jgi:CO/xanthine dehydrogenase FAD-binding subunit
VLPRLPGIVQDLEHRHRWRQHLHVAAGSPMISLTTSLEGVYSLRALDGSERQVPAIEFVTGNHQKVLQPGELLRAIDLPASALRKRGRSAACR